MFVSYKIEQALKGVHVEVGTRVVGAEEQAHSSVDSSA
jgi:hypothetical protein